MQHKEQIRFVWHMATIFLMFAFVKIGLLALSLEILTNLFILKTENKSFLHKIAAGDER